ncbi:glycosyltransferase family 2 protein [bacterium]|nr:glycosyltransferase family 2 protein [bacterium]
MIPISCKCITYGRVDLLEESIFSFLIQNYDGNSELIIINDYPLQKLIFDHPKIKIINLDKTFETIGDKENFAVSQCSYNTIAVWDDDDIALSNHLSNINKYFVDDSDLLHWQRGVAFNNKKISAITSLGNSGIVYSKKIWEKIGGHPKENAGYDMTFVIKIKENSNKIILASPPDNEVSWFYYWAYRSYHMSGLGADTPDRPNVIQRHSEHIEQLRQQGKIPTGDILLKPKWNLEYDKLLNKFLEEK